MALFLMALVGQVGPSKVGLKAGLWGREVWAAIACSVTLSVQLWSLGFLICDVGYCFHPED